MEKPEEIKVEEEKLLEQDKQSFCIFDFTN